MDAQSDTADIRIRSHRALSRLRAAGIAFTELASMRDEHIFVVAHTDLEKALAIPGINRARRKRGVSYFGVWR